MTHNTQNRPKTALRLVCGTLACAALVTALSTGLVACGGTGGQQGAGASSPAAQSSDGGSSSSSGGDIQTIADTAFVMTTESHRNEEAEKGSPAYGALEPVVSNTLDAHGNATSTSYGGHTHAVDPVTGADAGVPNVCEFTYDGNGFPTAINGGEILGYGSGEVQVAAEKEGTVFTTLYPSGATEVMTLYPDRLHIKQVTLTPAEDDMDAGTVSTVKYDHDGYATESTAEFGDGTVLTRSFRWKIDSDGTPVSCAVSVSSSKQGSAGKKKRDKAEELAETMPEEAFESATYVARTDDHGNIIAFDSADGSAYSSYEYTEVSNPSIKATLQAATKPAP